MIKLHYLLYIVFLIVSNLSFNAGAQGIKTSNIFWKNPMEKILCRNDLNGNLLVVKEHRAFIFNAQDSLIFYSNIGINADDVQPAWQGYILTSDSIVYLTDEMFHRKKLFYTPSYPIHISVNSNMDIAYFTDKDTTLYVYSVKEQQIKSSYHLESAITHVCLIENLIFVSDQHNLYLLNDKRIKRLYHSEVPITSFALSDSDYIFIATQEELLSLSAKGELNSLATTNSIQRLDYIQHTLFCTLKNQTVIQIQFTPTLQTP